jgi:uncharacterized protein YyaL (SSP411 family)
MLAGELMDRADHGFFRYATAADWSAPRYEKLLDVNALQLEAFALGACVRGRPDWEEVANATVAWVDGTLQLSNGLWGGSQVADEAWFALSAADRRKQPAPPIDATIYTSCNALWIAALATAGGRLGRSEWIERADRALELLIATMSAPNGLMFHYCEPSGERGHDFLLLDMVETARAAIALFQATGRASWLEHARGMAQRIEHAFWAEDGGFWDRTRDRDDIAALRYRERPFDLNSRCARLLLDLGLATGERGYRALAERTLALLSPQASRFGVAGAAFALAVEEFFTPPNHVVIVGDIDEAAALRARALMLPHAGRRVWSLPQGGRVGTQRIPAQPSPAAYACGRHGCSPPVLDDAALGAALMARV